MQKEYFNGRGEKILLNAAQLDFAQKMQRQFDSEHDTREKLNALGGVIDFNALTAIQSDVIRQKFFTIAPADFMEVRVGGAGAWATELLTYRSLMLAGAFQNGFIETGSNNTRLAEDNAGLDAVRVKTQAWAKQIVWALPELATASRLGNWNLVSEKESARKMDWDLGIQETAFLGQASIPGIYGLLTQPDVTVNTTLITESISGMTPAEFTAFLGALVSAFQTNANYTVMPDTFLIPQSDFNGLTTPSSDDFPLKSRLQIIQETLAAATNNPNFVVRGLPYGDVANNKLTVTRYVLYRRDPAVLRFEIPVDYTTTLAGTINNFQFTNVAYGQFASVKAYRPKEVLYFDR